MPAPRPTFTATVKDPAGLAEQSLAALKSSVLYAASLWGQYLVGSGNLSIAVDITSSPIGTADGGSVTSALVGQDDGINVFQSGASYKLATGKDPNGAMPDIKIDVDPNYLNNELWFDPKPQVDKVPRDKTDAISVFEHEIAHALGFDGFRDPDGNLTTAESPYDAYTTFDGSQPYFVGSAAEAVYGGPVPLTENAQFPTENIYHYGNIAGEPGSDLVPDGLMNGITALRGQRRTISDLDVAILSDTGAPVGEPDNGTSGNDDLKAGQVPVVADLYGGDDVFHGSAFNDFVFGGAGDDTIFGKGGNDVISGETGTNLLIGGRGADTYVETTRSAIDTIVGFDAAAGDLIAIGKRTYTVGTADDGSALLSLSGGGSVTLRGIDPDAVDASFFTVHA